MKQTYFLSFFHILNYAIVINMHLFEIIFLFK